VNWQSQRLYWFRARALSKGAASVTVAILCLAALASGAGAQAIAVDHRCVDLSATLGESVSWAAAERSEGSYELGPRKEETSRSQARSFPFASG